MRTLFQVLNKLSQASFATRLVVPRQAVLTRQRLNVMAAISLYKLPGGMRSLFRAPYMDKSHSLYYWSMDNIEKFYSIMFVDIDGVIKNRETVIDGAIERLNRWQRIGKTVIFVSNTCSNLPEDIVDKLEEYGFKTDVSHVVTSGDCLQAIKRFSLKGKNVFVVGNEASQEYVRRAGGVVFENSPLEASRLQASFIFTDSKKISNL